MKKNIFFRWAFYCLLISIHFNLSAQFITYPVNGSVFQQDGNNQATVSFSFNEINNYSQTIFYRLKKDGAIVSGKDRIVLNNPTFTNGGGLKGFKTTEILSKGWYTVEFYHEWQYWWFGWKTSNRMVELKEFGVGDVFFVAGQSNASGFYQLGIDEPTTFSSQNSIDLGGGNVRNHSDNIMVRTQNISGDAGANNAITKGLPNGTGFTNLTKSQSSIYPNGISSWSWAPLGNEFANHNATPTLFFNVAHPNSSLVHDWVGINPKKDKNSSTTLIGKFYQTLGFYGNILGAKSVLWHQGERDSQILAGFGNLASEVTDNYNPYLGELINFSRSITGLTDLPWFVSKVSYSSRGTGSNSCIYGNTNVDYSGKIFNSTLHNFQAKAGDSKVFIGVTSDFIDDDDWEGNSTNFSSSTTDCARAPMQRIHFTGDWLGKLGHAWYKAINNNYSSAVGKQSTQLLNITAVTKTLTKFIFTVQAPPANVVAYYWCKNDNGINNAQPNPNPKSPTSPQIALNSGERLICYVKDDLGRFYASQPYIRNECSNCRPDGNSIFSISPTLLTFNAGGETKSIIFNGAINDWDIQNAPAWITNVSWDDATQQLLITATNNTGAARSGSIQFVDSGTTNVLATLSVTQSASSGCTTVNLSTLTPVNVPTSEWSG